MRPVVAYPKAHALWDISFWTEVARRLRHAAQVNVCLLDRHGDVVDVQVNGRTDAASRCLHHLLPGASHFHRFVAEKAQREGIPVVEHCPVGLQCIALPLRPPGWDGLKEGPDKQHDVGVMALLVDCHADTLTDSSEIMQAACEAGLQEGPLRMLAERLKHPPVELPSPAFLHEMLQHVQEWVGVQWMRDMLNIERWRREAIRQTLHHFASLVGADMAALASLESREGRRCELAIIASANCGETFAQQSTFDIDGNCIEFLVAEQQQPRWVEPRTLSRSEDVVPDASYAPKDATEASPPMCALAADTFLVVPVVWQGMTIAILYAATAATETIPTCRPFTQDSIRLAKEVAAAIAPVLAAHRDRAVNSMKNELRYCKMTLQAFQEIENAICSTCDLKDMLDLILKNAVDLVSREQPTKARGCLALVEEDGCHVASTVGYPSPTTDTPASEPDMQVADETRDLLARVAATGEAVRDTHRSTVAVPMKMNNAVLGVLLIECDDVDVGDPEDTDVLVALANHAAIAYENARLFRQSREETKRSRELAERMAALCELSGTNQVGLRVDDYLDAVVASAARILHAEECSVFLKAEDDVEIKDMGSGIWILRATRGLPSERVSQMYTETGRGLTGWIAQQGQALRLTATQDMPDLYVASSNQTPESQSPLTAHFLGAPLKIGDVTIGILRARRLPSAPQFSAEDESFVKAVAEQSAKVVHNALLLEKLQEEDHLKSQLMSTLAHELKTPLTSILLFTEILQDGGRPAAEQSELLGIIKEEAERYTRLVDKVMMTSRIETGKLSANKEPVDPQKISEQVASLFRTQAEKRNISLRVHTQGRLPLIMADPDLVKQALANLVDNALKFSSSGGKVDIILDLKPRHVVVTVKDTGRGIQPEAQKHILERFWQGDGSLPGTVVGTGLGLSIVKHIAELHGSRIVFESEVGKGSQFSFALPLAETFIAGGSDE